MEFEQAFDSVFVLESLPAKERQTGYELFSGTISPYARRNDIRGEHKSVADKAGFVRAIEGMEGEARRKGLSPILHIEAHGCESGLELADGSFVAWSELRPYLEALNCASLNSLLVCSSACDGGYLLRVALPEMWGRPCPFWGSMGPVGAQAPGNLLRGFEGFYRVLLNQQDAGAALKALYDEVDPGVLCLAEHAFVWSFGHYIDLTLDASERRNRIERIVQQSGAPPSEVDKRLADINAMEGDFYQMRAHYLHIDAHPELRSRFKSTFRDACAQGGLPSV